MKFIVHLALLSTSLISTGAFARVIYGVDNRIEVHEAKILAQWLARSAATMIPNNKMTVKTDGMVELAQAPMRSWFESPTLKSKIEKLLTVKGMEFGTDISFCDGERFIDQPNPGMCSGFLIAPDLIVTAGHCVETEKFCEDYKWVFDFKTDLDGKAGESVHPNNIYSCKKVVSNSLNMTLGLDYAVVQLDRLVKNRRPLEIRSDGAIEDHAGLVVIGNPSGLPLKVAAGARVRNNEHPFYFNANLDTFQGNSGSAVFNTKTGAVEGILVRGDEDFDFSYEYMCLGAKKCEDDHCRGEDVSRITSIPEVYFKGALHAAAEQGEVGVLKKILDLKVWVDFYGRDRRSALMKAAAKGMARAVSLLLEKGAEVNLTDMNGESPLHHAARFTGEGHDEVFKFLIASNADTEIMNAQGETPILLAAKANNVSALKQLVVKGAKINIHDSSGENALFFAIRNHSLEAVKILLEGGIDTYARNREGISPVSLTYREWFRQARVLIKKARKGRAKK